MAGYSQIYVIGGSGGCFGADGVNPIELIILVGDADRQWYEPHYFDKTIFPIGNIRAIVPAKPDDPDALLDACLAFYPNYFKSCPSMAKIQSALSKTERLDFHLNIKDIPSDWTNLRNEARPIFSKMKIWKADFIPVERI